MSIILYTWDGEAMQPLKRFAKVCDKEFVVGQVYNLTVQNERSKNSHDHFFAQVEDSWLHLPEKLAQRFPTAEHLRKWCLIKSGFADHRQLVCESADEALRLGAFIRPSDPFAVITVNDCVVTVYTAKSQSYRKMGKVEFQKSKDAVFRAIAALIEVEESKLRENVGA